MVNGYPGTMIIPGGKLSRNVKDLAGATFNVSDGSPITTTDIGDTETASKYTRLTFSNPVFLEGGKDYCFVLKSPSALTSVWTSIRGQTDVFNNTTIDDQPYLGSAFVSQNNITWNAEQNRDITFRLLRAEFDVSSPSVITLENDTTEVNTKYNIGMNLDRPGLVIETDEGSNYITVIHPNHSMYDTAHDTTVDISGVVANRDDGSFNGIPITAINGEHEVLRPTLDTYQIIIGDSEEADMSGCGGGNMVQATQNFQYDKLTTAIMSYAPTGSEIKTSAQTTSGTSLWLTQQGISIKNAAAEVVDGVSRVNPDGTPTELQPSYQLDTEYSDITPFDINEFATPRLLTNSLNNGSVSSLFIRLELSAEAQDDLPANRSRISPVIDLASNDGFSSLPGSTREAATGLVFGEADATTGIQPLLSSSNTVTPGATPPSVILSLNHVHRSINDTQLDNLVVALADGADSEIANIRSYFKQGQFSNIERTAYVTKEVTLENEADRITVIFDVDAEPGNDIRIWVKASSVEDDTPLSELDWIELSNITEFEDSRGPINNDNDNLSSAEDFTEFTFDSGDDGFPSFNAFTIRITIDTENEAEPPKFANFRTIATA